MKGGTIKPGMAIVLNEGVPESVDTGQRRRTAQTILEMWPDEKKDIAEEAGVSRTHVDNVLKSHFEPLIQEPEFYAIKQTDIESLLDYLKAHWSDGFTRGESSGVSIDLPDDESPEFVKGYMAGYMAHYEQVFGNSPHGSTSDA